LDAIAGQGATMRKLAKVFWIVLALLFLLEAWLWTRLEPIVEWIVGLFPWRRLKARLAAAIEHLPPAAMLVVFLVPLLLLVPFKLAGWWLLAKGQWLAAVVVLVLAKLVGVGVTAFVFDATREKLLQMGWFRALYEKVLAANAWAHARVDPIKRRIKAWVRWLRGRDGDRMWRRLMQLRRKAQRSAAS
jgi:hypothetical protein